MKKKYLEPKTEFVLLNLSEPYMRIPDVIGGGSTPGEGEGTGWGGAKENGGFFDEEPFGSLWDEDPVEDPFSIDDY